MVVLLVVALLIPNTKGTLLLTRMNSSFVDDLSGVTQTYIGSRR